MTNYKQQAPIDRSFACTLLPTAPEWRTNWDLIQTIPEIQAMRGCLQNPEHHAEGDVLAHTMMVCEALTRIEKWRSLPESERTIVFLSALLHDIAKPLCSEKDENDKISSREHTKLGASLSRFLLWQGLARDDAAPFAVRHAVDRLVRYSGLPLWFLEKPDPIKATLKAALSVRMDWLCLLAEADVRGRSCQDQNELLERVFLFEQFCSEHNCLNRAPGFPSDHSRFSYFRSDSNLPDRMVYDDRKMEVTMMSGLPASGKDYWIDAHVRDQALISLDRIRAARKIDAQEDQNPVIAEARELAKTYLRSGRSFAWNATNISRFMRSGLLDLFSNYGARIKIVYCEPSSFAELVSRNSARANPVPVSVLEKLARRLEVPELSEAHIVEYVTD